MLTSISWGQYLHVLLIAVPAYYLIVLAIYFSRDIHGWLLAFTQKITKAGSNRAGSKKVTKKVQTE